MEDTNSLIEQRRAKLKSLESKGIFPFRNKFTPDRACHDARNGFDTGALPEGTRVSVAGRITAHREMGKSIFVDVRDQSGRIQVYAQKNALGDEQFHIFTHLDIGDFIGVTGTLFRTKMGEPSLKLESFVILSKALRPPPAKWHGLEDTEIRYRQRYLDLIANPEVNFASAASQVAWSGRHGNPLSPALPGSHRQSGGEERLPATQRHRS
jgi:lysyl-tRNA synthetase class 2